MEYDYSEALKRQGHKQADVDALRKIVQKFSVVPKSITNKQVKTASFRTLWRELTVWCNLLIFTDSFVLGFMWWHRWRREDDESLLRAQAKHAWALRQPWSWPPKNRTMSPTSRLLLPSEHTARRPRRVPPTFKLKVGRLPFRWGYKNILYDDR